MTPQYKFIYDNGMNLQVDFVGRFENLKNDFDYISSKLIKKPAPLQHLQKTSHEDYNLYYNKDMKKKVFELYEKDFSLFGYEY